MLPALGAAKGASPHLLYSAVATPQSGPVVVVDDDGMRTALKGWGLQVIIARFRARWSAAPPAIPVTGDTAADRLTDAQARGVQLPHKPVVTGKLRAAVGELVTRRIATARRPVLAGASSKSM